MSSYHDPTLRGDVYPSEEESDPTGVGPDPAYPTTPAPAPTPEPEPAPAPGPGPAPRTADSTYLDGDRDGRLDTVLREPGGPAR
ncbi:hypothetical protein OG799_00835 [Micromonospora sp. NBC_00898]|uniref:hypothetical protein n=1 Tax=Micromonospora sp. NBC_00898 TaxID=2975981 RepID=UPI00386C6A74|nr:hypothetical protein OG799_00835 [Micromonospora sp. NBC_00898]